LFNTVNQPFAVDATGNRAANTFAVAANEFAALVYCETVRWGDYYYPGGGGASGFRKSNPNYLPGQTKGDFDRNTGYLINTWIPQRRTNLISHLRLKGLAD
jgi:hypothetical protein